MKALVVDDSSVMRRLHQKTLEKMGFSVALAEDGRQALAAFDQSPCDLVVTDLHMPNMDGLALIAALRAKPQPGALKILMATSDGVLDVMQKALDAGANDVLIKPFSASVFTERVEGLTRVS